MRLLTLFCTFALLSMGQLSAAGPSDGFRSIFDGESLNGWKGEEGFWRVENGSLIGETTAEKKLEKNTFIVWENGPVDDFELRFEYKLADTPGANSGVQFRGIQKPDGQVVGYQADIDFQGAYVGSLYDEAARGPLASRGESKTLNPEGQSETTTIADSNSLVSKVRPAEWNSYSIRAQGGHIQVRVNGELFSELFDNDPAGLDLTGLLALQLHAGPPMKIEFKDIQLKRLPLQDGWKKVVFIAGNPSHGYSEHEHNAGCLLLARQFDEARKAGLKIIDAVYLNGWPKDMTALDNADTVVAYCDGGGGHFLNPHLKEFDELVNSRGVGLVCIHYGVETVTGEPGNHFLKWMGGFFEPHWSVNPHWDANYETLPKHPVTQGVQPFEINDEWYYHMRFVPDMTGVTPILTALPPRETLNRPDGTHSNNPHVREALLERNEPQHTAWAYERPDGKGRGFGFTGGHFHGNWQHDDFRKLVLNAIVWTAHGDVPENGVDSRTPTDAEMAANNDGTPPEGYQYRSRVQPKADSAKKKMNQ